MERLISPDEHLENLRVVLSTRDVELLIAFWYESWRLEELGEEVREQINTALPALSSWYGLREVKTFRELVEAYDEAMLPCSEALNNCLVKFAGEGDVKNVKAAIRKGAQNFEGTLYAAALGGHVKMVDFLLPLVEQSEVDQGLYGAAQGDHSELINLFLEKGAGWKWGLYGAARGGHRDLFDRFLEDIIFADDLSYSNLYKKYDREVLPSKLVFEAEDVRNGLYQAALGGHQYFMDFFRKKGAAGDKGIRGAALGGHFELTFSFLEKKPQHAAIALREAAKGGHLELVKYFVEEKGINDPIRLSTVLDSAALDGHEEVVDYLIEKGARNSKEVVFALAKGGHFTLLKKYLRSELLNLALRGAVSGGHLDIVQWLIAEGADDLSGAANVALKSNHQYMIGYFREMLGEDMPELQTESWFEVITTTDRTIRDQYYVAQ